jgi:hypothetical protein
LYFFAVDRTSSSAPRLLERAADHRQTRLDLNNGFGVPEPDIHTVSNDSNALDRTGHPDLVFDLVKEKATRLMQSLRAANSRCER